MQPAGWAGLCLVAMLVAGCSPKPPTAPTPLAITSQPSDQSVSLGQQATLQVVGQSSMPLSYQWYSGARGDESSPVDGASAATYRTPDLLATARFWVRVSDGNGAVDSTTATVTVMPPSGGAGPAPSITTEPEDDFVEPGQTAKLDVGVSGAAPIRYQWFLGSTGDTTSPIAGATADVYRTPPLEVTTRFWVRIWNDAGVTDSVTATITVAEAPPPGAAPAIIRDPVGQAVASGAKATLDVEASGADPLDYQWFEGTTGDVSAPVAGGTSASVVTPPIFSSTPYWVRVSNPYGAADSETAWLTVGATPPPPANQAPAITSHPQSQAISSGQAASLAVIASGSAPLTYQWFVGSSGDVSTPVGGATSAGYTTPSLVSTTSYWVRVSNAFGTVDSLAATITVSVPGSSSTAFEDQVLVLVNQHRAAGATCGGTAYAATGPLAMDETLRSVARAHSLDMGTQHYFSHTSLDGRTFDQRMSGGGYSGSHPWGENIAAGYGSPSAVVTGWMNSPGHCANIMKPGYAVVGVGHAQVPGSPYGTYWTQDFGGS